LMPDSFFFYFTAFTWKGKRKCCILKDFKRLVEIQNEL